jgi:hypothetical protein
MAGRIPFTPTLNFATPLKPHPLGLFACDVFAADDGCYDKNENYRGAVKRPLAWELYFPLGLLKVLDSDRLKPSKPS